ncbi:hypothetical protein M404DRAFT_165051 [Pisolithus tinctorius Marx 270]|uniref:Uncharacterized protein n=1 Tax=Pisolithus tinctorius Marx 270 TaxID=870435 RepID=A0A0C3NJC3_PISTI|nr:hypothetical protein M404DRAFT_165051 [Pisolithus tinctorius Marx 270]
MELTDCIASYMKARFQEEVFSGPRALPDILIPFPVLCEADCISSVISQAYRRPMTEPSILVTDSNTICVWYLPDALSPKRRVRKCRISYSTDLIIKASPQAWRMDKSYFHDDAELKGAINLSPAWFQQGRGVGDHCSPCK